MTGHTTLSDNGKVRIAQLLPALEEGGVERGVVDMNRQLSNYGFDSVVISRGGRLAKTIEEDGGQHVTLEVARKSPLTFAWQALQLYTALRRVRPNIVHVRSRLPAWLLRVANQSLHIPCVTTVHGFNHVSPYSRIMTHGARVICPSTALKSYIQRHYGTPEKKITVIPRGIDVHHFDPKHVNHELCHELLQTFNLERALW